MASKPLEFIVIVVVLSTFGKIATAKPQKIVLVLAGTFDPIHNKDIARLREGKKYLDELTRQKKAALLFSGTVKLFDVQKGVISLASSGDKENADDLVENDQARIKMANLSLDDEMNKWVEVSDWGIKHGQNVKSTIEVMDHHQSLEDADLNREYNGKPPKKLGKINNGRHVMYLCEEEYLNTILGCPQADADILLRKYRILVAVREKSKVEKLIAITPMLSKYAHNIWIFEFKSEHALLSSTAVKEAIRQKQSLAKFVPIGVENYILENELYKIHPKKIVFVLFDTFNPIHNGHIAMLRNGKKYLNEQKYAYGNQMFDVQKAIISPVNGIYTKWSQPIRMDIERIEMANLGLDQEMTEWVKVSTREVELKGIFDKLDVLDYYQKVENDYVERVAKEKNRKVSKNERRYVMLLCTADRLNLIPQRKQPERLLTTYGVLVATGIQSLQALQNAAEQNDIVIKHQDCIRFFDIHDPKGESAFNDIDEALWNEKPITEYVPPAVAKYISEKGLYERLPKKIALVLAGTFNPIHYEHIAMLRECKKYLDELTVTKTDSVLGTKNEQLFDVQKGVISLVSGGYQKNGDLVGNDQARIDMANLSLDPEMKKWVKVSDWELKDSQNVKSRIEVLDHEQSLENAEPSSIDADEPPKKSKIVKRQVMYLCGEDHLSVIPGWTGGERLLRDYGILVAPREKTIAELKIIIANTPMLNQYAHNIRLFEVNSKYALLSSSALKEAIRKKESLDKFVPIAVEKYIFKNELYKIHPKKIVFVLSDTFNPFHNGHIAMLRNGKKYLNGLKDAYGNQMFDVQKAILSPITGASVIWNDPIGMNTERIEMASLGLESEMMSWVEISTWEVELKGLVDKVDVLEHYQKAEDEYVESVAKKENRKVSKKEQRYVMLLCTAVHLSLIPKQKNPEKLLKTYGILVVTASQSVQVLQNIMEQTAILRNEKKYIRFCDIDDPQERRAFNEIDKAISDRNAIDEFIPPAVAEYISREKLYHMGPKKIVFVLTASLHPIHKGHIAMLNDGRKYLNGVKNGFGHSRFEVVKAIISPVSGGYEQRTGEGPIEKVQERYDMAEASLDSEMKKWVKVSIWETKEKRLIDRIAVLDKFQAEEDMNANVLVDSRENKSVAVEKRHIMFLCGEDQLRHIHVWKDWEMIFKKYSMLAAISGKSLEEAQNGVENNEILKIHKNKIQFFDVLDAQAREAYKEIPAVILNGKPIEEYKQYLPSGVADYIKKHNVYKKKEN